MVTINKSKSSNHEGILLNASYIQSDQSKRFLNWMTGRDILYISLCTNTQCFSSIRPMVVKRFLCHYTLSQRGGDPKGLLASYFSGQISVIYLSKSLRSVYLLYGIILLFRTAAVYLFINSSRIPMMKVRQCFLNNIFLK